SKDEVAGHTGATHLLEHLMFKGTRRFNRDKGTEIARILQRIGANFNATTWLDRTNYYATVAVEHLETPADIEADRMRGALVRNEDLDKERSVVLNELDRGENEPFGVLLKGLFAHAYIEHPYHHPTIGWRGDVEAIQGETLRRFYDTFYQPDNATVIVSGDIEEQPALDLVERFFGPIERGPGRQPQGTIREGRQRGERRFSVHRAGELGFLGCVWHIPEGLHADLAPLGVAAQILSEGVVSRLNMRLVETNLCLGVHASAMESHDPGLFQIFATLAPGVEHADVEAMILEEVQALGAAVPEQGELARAKVQRRTDLAFQQESPARLVSALTEGVAIGDWRIVVDEMDHVAGVQAEDVMRVCHQYLRSSNQTIGWFVPECDPEGDR
ncbi:MAG: insulinase family protein, partial [Acidobacteria bacterium]